MAAPKQRWAHVLGAHERAHVRIFKKILGDKAEKRPFFNFHGVTESDDAFTRTAVAMEDLTVALLAGADPGRPRPPPHRGALQPADDRGPARRLGAPHRQDDARRQGVRPAENA